MNKLSKDFNHQHQSGMHFFKSFYRTPTGTRPQLLLHSRRKYNNYYDMSHNDMDMNMNNVETNFKHFNVTLLIKFLKFSAPLSAV